MTRRLLILVFLLGLSLAIVSIALAQRQIRVDNCPAHEYLRERLPTLPEGQYPIIGFFLSDAYEGSPQLSELIFSADPNLDGCFERYRVVGRYVFTHNGGAFENTLLKVWRVENTLHLHIGSGGDL
jgi:hypothetical protein